LKSSSRCQQLLFFSFLLLVDPYACTFPRPFFRFRPPPKNFFQSQNAGMHGLAPPAPNFPPPIHHGRSLGFFSAPGDRRTSMLGPWGNLSLLLLRKDFLFLLLIDIDFSLIPSRFLYGKTSRRAFEINPPQLGLLPPSSPVHGPQIFQPRLCAFVSPLRIPVSDHPPCERRSSRTCTPPDGL